MSHMVKCTKCGKNFDRDKVPFIMTGTRRYAHKDCGQEIVIIKKPQRQAKNDDQNNLYEFISELYGVEFAPVNIRKQINDYIKDYNMTFTGIQKTLYYFYKIQGNPLDKDNPTIGIVPYVYEEASNYYKRIWEAQQKNSKKYFQLFIPKEEVVRIVPPERKPMKKRELFSFLDEGDEDVK